jgi:hypothetical protein
MNTPRARGTRTPPGPPCPGAGHNFTLKGGPTKDKYRVFRLIVTGKRGSQQSTMSLSGLKFWGKQ